MFSARLPPLVWGGIAALVALAVPTWRFGRPFLFQFFISPFQFFILPLWLLAYWSVRTGVMPMRSGPPLRRDEDPAAFRQNVRYCILMGAAMFAFNLWISWQVRRPVAGKLERLRPHPNMIAGDSEDLVHLDWSSEWKP